MAEATKHDIRLKRTGGAGINAQWSWEIYVDGKSIKKGSAVGDEARAYATARKFADKLAKG
jgi:hypothetical protein